MLYYVLLNISVPLNSIFENSMDNECLKDIAFSSKIKTKSSIDYNNVLCPVESDVALSDSVRALTSYTLSKLGVGVEVFKDPELNAIWTLLSPAISKKLTRLTVSLDKRLTPGDMDILYSDGSSSKAENAASYGCCKLTKQDPTGLLDELTGQTFLYETFSGRIEDGTNNIGELTGVRTAINNIDEEKHYHVIISDSNYSIKTYREYIYNWRNNGYKTYNKKDIANKQLIIDTYAELEAKNDKNIILFKWTKGHVGTSFNEVCDELAKNELGIQK